jgi:hypothetical protein
VPLGLTALGVASFAVYAVAPGRIADRAAVPYALALGLAPALAWAWMRACGARAGEAAWGAGLLPGLWLAKELWRTSGVYPLAETLFFLLNPVCLGVVGLAVFEASAAEWAWARWRGRRAPTAAVLPVVAGLLVAAAAGLAGGDRLRALFYAYVDLHRALFGS